MTKPLLYLILCCAFPVLMYADGAREELRRKYQKEHDWTVDTEAFLNEIIQDSSAYSPLDRTYLDTLYKKCGVHINFSEEFAYHALRKNDLDKIVHDLKTQLNLRKWQKLHLCVDGLPLEQYVPNYYLDKTDKSRQGRASHMQHVVRRSQVYQSSKGLDERHIALWNSHGKYYNHKDSCWKWQRAPLFSTVEDLFTSTYILPFLVPMLEHAGANVYLPRERDVQTHEVIVDNEDEGFSVRGYCSSVYPGYASHLLLDHSAINPFFEGNSCVLDKKTTAIWQVSLPEEGAYAVYVAYAYSKKNSKQAYYDVYHSGGVTTFEVNQQIGSGTWVYLGHFDFDKEAKVMLKGKNANADVVRLGGGMGDIPRDGKVSGVPRWQEAARYYLQYSGALDSLTFNRHGDTTDYNDDFRSRARWVNYLIGDKAIEPWLKNDTKIQGLHIPIDLSLGLHTDAGHFTSMDTTVGTLAIYSTYDVAKNRNFYYSKKSRLANRDLADLVQTQIVDDIRALYDSTWTRRELWDKMYSEATFAQVPSLLLEIQGHGNVQDMRYGLNPQFRFDVSRAIYKACLRFLSTCYDEDYVVQPLPVRAMAIMQHEGHHILQWEPVVDSLEPSAAPDAYVVYRKVDASGWDNGTLVKGTSYVLPENAADLCSYKVCAVNAGGASFPSLALSMVTAKASDKTILVIDGFTRVDAPAFVECGDSVGLAPWQDEGVAYGVDIGTIGWQYNYDQNEPWLSDDKPGHGGSSFELSDSIFLGNDFSTTSAYAKAIRALGYNVLSASAEAVENGRVRLADFDAVVMAYGEQRFSLLPSGKMAYDILSPRMVELLSQYLDHDGRLFINGAHLATSTQEGAVPDRMLRLQFLKNYCGIAFASKVKPYDNHITHLSDSLRYHYNVAYCKDYYRVENADAFRTDDDVVVLDTYHGGLSAAVFCQKKGRVISSGLPFETIVGEEKRVKLMRLYLEKLWNEAD